MLRLRQLLLIEWNRIGAFYCYFSLGVYLWPCCRRTTTPFFCVAWRQMQQLFLRQQKQLPSCNDFHLQNPPQLLPHEHGWANLSWSSGGAFPRKRGRYQRFPNWGKEYRLAHWTQIFFREECNITDTVRLRFFPEGPSISFVKIVKQKIDFFSPVSSPSFPLWSPSSTRDSGPVRKVKNSAGSSSGTGTGWDGRIWTAPVSSPVLVLIEESCPVHSVAAASAATAVRTSSSTTAVMLLRQQRSVEAWSCGHRRCRGAVPKGDLAMEELRDEYVKHIFENNTIFSDAIMNAMGSGDHTRTIHLQIVYVECR